MDVSLTRKISLIQKKFSTDDLVKLNKIHHKKKCLIDEITSLQMEHRQIIEEMKKYNCIIDGRIEDPKTRNLRIGKRKFNHNPEEGIEYMISKNAIGQSASQIANFLLDKTLNKMAVGNYIGNISKKINVEVLKEYVDLYDFSGLEFLDAIRLFLSGFHLPGESQKIDRIIDEFSKSYFQQNQAPFKDASETYLMTYAVIMLNTCLHNPIAKKANGGFGKEEDFIKIMHGHNPGIDLSFAKKMFHSIKTEPLSCNHLKKDDHIQQKFDNVEYCGWLWKLGGRVKNWKKRWFILTEHSLVYFVHPNSHSMKGIISFENVYVRTSSAEKDYQHCFEICSSDLGKIKGCKNDNSGKKVLGHHYSYKMCAISQTELNDWIDAIQRCINTIWQEQLLKGLES